MKLNKFGHLPWIAAMAFFMETLDATILNTAIPSMSKSLQVSPLSMQSAIISYTLTVALLIPLSGWLADRFGTRRIFTIAVILFSSGSLCCALSPTLPLLVMSRVLQGIGGAIMVPVARLSLLRAYPKEELLPVLNFVMIPGLIGPVLGPLLGGVIVTYMTWHWIFLINIPIGLIGIFATRRYMPNFVLPKREFDFSGFALFSLSLVIITASIECLGEGIGSSYLGAVLAIIFGVFLLVMYVRHAKRCAYPLIELKLFKNRLFSIGLTANIVARLGLSSVPFLLPLMMQLVFLFSPLLSGLMMIPLSLGSLMAKSLVTRNLNQFGFRRLLISLTLVIGMLICGFALQVQTTPLWLLAIAVFILGVSMSTQFTSINTIALGSLNQELASAGNSVYSVSQQLAITYGISLSAVLLRIYHNELHIPALSSFHYTFISMGVLTMLSVIIFISLKKNDGDNLLPGRKLKEKRLAQ